MGEGVLRFILANKDIIKMMEPSNFKKKNRGYFSRITLDLLK